MVLDGARNSASKGLTAVHLAVQQGCDSLVADLLRLPGLAPDARDADGLTSLHWAASKGVELCLQGCPRSLMVQGLMLMRDQGLDPCRFHPAAPGCFRASPLLNAECC